MADRGRDLKVAILSDVSRFDTAKPADQLDKVAAAADRADRALDRVHPQDATRLLDKLGDEAKDVARRVDDAFDAIARTAKAGTSKLGVEASTAKRKLSEIGDEAKDSAREALASFSSFGGDLADAGQELAANAGALFGPVGLAIGGALSAGIAMFAQEAAKLTELTNKIIGDLLDAGGRVTQELVSKRLHEMGDEINATSAMAAAARINVEDFNLALAGDPEAIKRTSAEFARRGDEMARLAAESANSTGLLNEDLLAQERALEAVAQKLGLHADASSRAEAAIARMTGAQEKMNTTASATEGALATAVAAYRAAERAMRDPIVVRLDVDLGAFNAKIAGAQRKLDALTRYTP